MAPRIKKKKLKETGIASHPSQLSLLLEKVSFFLLNRAEVPTPSFLPSLKVLLRHRNKYPKKKLDKKKKKRRE